MRPTVASALLGLPEDLGDLLDLAEQLIGLGDVHAALGAGGARQLGDHEVVPISIATEARKLAGFTDEEIERLIKTTQRSQVY